MAENVLHVIYNYLLVRDLKETIIYVKYFICTNCASQSMSKAIFVFMNEDNSQNIKYLLTLTLTRIFSSSHFKNIHCQKLTPE